VTRPLNSNNRSEIHAKPLFRGRGGFGKYGLLRALAGHNGETSPLSLGIVWYLVPDEDHNEDGRHISYLTNPAYRACDPELHDILHRLLIAERQPRRVELTGQYGLLPASTHYFEPPLDYRDIAPVQGETLRAARLAYRKQWREQAPASCSGRDVVFLDPDNGFETASVPKHAPKAPKYVYWDEFDRFADLGKTLVIYHHLNRTQSARDQIATKVAEIRKRRSECGDPIALLFRRGSLRVFFILPAPRHRDVVRDRIDQMLSGPWSAHFDSA